MNAKPKVFVGVSGGVDSSVCAYLLKQKGYDVQGIFVKTWSPEWLPCTWVNEKRDAMRVCASLDIPFHFLDASQEYEHGVAEYMIAEYKAGRTPNPDVLCNRVIKFGAMWEYAKALGATHVATGHYAQTDGITLSKGSDGAKDQSYFLWMITKDELPHILFPVGALPKKKVRSIAKKAGLLTASKKDSQGICFLGDVDMRDFLSHYIEEKSGNVVTSEGEIIGTHTGVWFYTLGERHGFHIAKKTPDDKPYYVIAKNVHTNELVVSHELPTSKEGKLVQLRDSNWIAEPVEGKVYSAQIRYHGELISATYSAAGISLHSPIVPLGQSLVLYDGELLVGGGVIDKVE